MIDTLRLTGEEAMSMLERGDVSAEELHAAYAARDDDVHAFLRRLDYAGAEGVPIALKDVIGTKGVETTAGSKILAGYVPLYDSTVASRVKDARLPLLGKTNTDEFAMGSSTEAAPPRRSPPVSRRGPLAPTPAGRSSSRLRCAGSSGSGRRTERSRATASSPSHRRSTRLGPRRRRSETAHCSTGSSPAAIRGTRRRSTSRRSRYRAPRISAACASACPAS